MQVGAQFAVNFSTALPIATMGDIKETRNDRSN